MGELPRIELIPPVVPVVAPRPDFEGAVFEGVVVRRPELRFAVALLLVPDLALAVLGSAVVPAALLRVADLVDDARPVRVVRPRAALEAAALEVKSNPVLIEL